MGKKVTIVFEETGEMPGGEGFTIVLDGIAPERRSLPDDQLSAAEFWGKKCFLIVGNIVQNAGAVQCVVPRDPVKRG